MGRLHAEIARLYLTETSGHTRALVLGLNAPADGHRLLALAQSMQAELGWPAPACAIDGVAACQLWWSLAEPLALDRAAALLEALAARWLADLAPAACVKLLVPAAPATPWPGAPTGPGRWSAFIAPDLAPVFSAEPWLDIPPGEAGQAELLAGLRPITGAELAQALSALSDAPAPETLPAAPPGTRPAVAAPGSQEPRAFLLGVMNDPGVPLALRIEAAKALLAGTPLAASAGALTDEAESP